MQSRIRMAAFLLLALSRATCLEAKQLTIYVSPSGNDAWSGGQPKSNAKRNDGPLATLPAAIQAARTVRRTVGAEAGIHILLRGGTYELSAPVVLTPEDSG